MCQKHLCRSGCCQRVLVRLLLAGMEATILSPVAGPSESPVEPPKKKPGLNPSGLESPRWKPMYLAAAEEIKALKASLAIWERAAEFQDDGVISSGVMKRVLGQSKDLDVGPTQATLRAWLDRDVKGYEARMRQLAEEESGAAAREKELEDLRAEVAELRKASSPAGIDAGAARARDIIGKILGSKVSR